jgi:MFS family permease
MKQSLSQYRSFERPVRLLLVNQLAINVGFYMLMPYLADHLSDELALATWLVGLVLGVRNLSQQGMFLVGGTIADRLGYKPAIVAGCALRTGGFVLLGLVDTLPALLVASAATGFAGALFNPAVRAYVAHDAGGRRVEAFALFNVFYQAGILLGPVIGLVLTGVAFRLTCLVAAAVFAALTVVQVRALPARRPASTRTGDRGSWRDDWRTVVANRPFVLFSVAMVGSYVLAFQIYLALPLETRRLAGDGATGTAAVTALFVVSGLVALVGQVSITAWCKRRWPPGRCLAVGLTVLATAFVPPLAVSQLATDAATASSPTAVALRSLPLLASAALLALGTVIVFPFEMDTITVLARSQLPATHYGLYNTICGVGILTGNLATGTALDAARNADLAALPWLALSLVGLACAAAIRTLDRRARLAPAPPGPVLQAR